ncbi:MAG TPA: helix-turn-helix domain-containing protein [Mycobacterium sp.]|nr:helix-turn-helix domain-containing protein [Mycobacterium sp.]
MEVDGTSALDPDAQRVWQQVLRPTAAEMRAAAPDLAERIVARIRAEMPQLFPDAQTVEENLTSAEAGIRQLADIIDIAGDPRGIELPAPTVAIARAGVQRQIPLANFMRFYRVAQDLLWQWMFTRITATSAEATQQATALKLATSWLFGYIDAALIRAEQAYEAEREAWLRGAAATRTVAIEDILANRERDPQRASKRLRYEVNRHHVGVIAWVDSLPEDRDAQPVLGDALANLAHCIGAETTLVQPVGSLAAAGWLSCQTAFKPSALDAFTSSRTLALPRGLRVGIGDPGRGLKGFRRSHVEASHARRVASLCGTRADPLTRYRDVAVAALASADVEHAASFVNRVLGSLAAADETTYRVALTLSVYLQENRSRVRAAERLTVHPNTVSYRVQQAETILGRSIDIDSLDLSVALALLPTLPGLTHAQAAETVI